MADASSSHIASATSQENLFERLGVVFVHIPRTGGTSTHSFLSMLNRKAGADSQHASAIAALRRSKRDGKHMKAAAYASLIGRDRWAKIPSFTIVRNPWDYCVSCHRWWLQKARKWPNHGDDAAEVERLGTFGNFLRSERFAKGPAGHDGFMQEWFTDGAGDLVTQVIRHETLEKSLRSFLRDNGVETDGVPFPHLNGTERGDYRGEYSGEDAEIVADRFRYVVERFGYRFD